MQFFLSLGTESIFLAPILCTEIGYLDSPLLFLAEELRLQRNPENYALLRRHSASKSTTTSPSSKPKKSATSKGQGQPTEAGGSLDDSTFNDRTEFLITKVSIVR